MTRAAPGVCTRWVPVPPWPDPAALQDHPAEPERHRESPWAASDRVRRLLDLTVAGATQGPQRPLAQRVLMLSAAGVPLPPALLETSQQILAHVSARDHRRMNAIARVWARQLAENRLPG